MIKLRFNHLAVLVAVIVTQIIPTLWYWIFADMWADALGKDLDDLGSAPMGYVFGMLQSVVLAYFLSAVFQYMKIVNWKDGLAMGIFFWAITAVHVATLHFFSLRPGSLVFIDAGVLLLTFAATGMIMAGWQPKDAADSDADNDASDDDASDDDNSDD